MGIHDTVVALRNSLALTRAALWLSPPAPAQIDPVKIAFGPIKLARGIGAKLTGAVIPVTRPRPARAEERLRTQPILTRWRSGRCPSLC